MSRHFVRVHIEKLFGFYKIFQVTHSGGGPSHNHDTYVLMNLNLKKVKGWLYKSDWYKGWAQMCKDIKKRGKRNCILFFSTGSTENVTWYDESEETCKYMCGNDRNV